MLDMRGWIVRAAGFAPGLTRQGGLLFSRLEIRPPLTGEELTTLEGRLDCTVPAALGRFLREGSSRFRFVYDWFPPAERCSVLDELFPSGDSISGGDTLCDTEEMPGHRTRCQQLAREGWMAAFPLEQQRWLNGLPFVYLETGDYLALDLSSRGEDPSVLYLCHDDESRVLAPTFEAFLQVWERLCYVEISALGLFRHPDGGFVDADTSEADRLRSLFGAA